MGSVLQESRLCSRNLVLRLRNPTTTTTPTTKSLDISTMHGSDLDRAGEKLKSHSTAFLWGLGGVRFRDQSSTSVTSLDYENSRSPLGTSILWLCASGGGSRGRGRGWGTHGTSTPSKGVQNTLDWPVQINDMESVRHVKSAAFPVTGGGHVKTPHVACIHHIDMTTTFSDSVEN